MAVYDFTCSQCQKDFTVNCSMAERKNASCPVCGSRELTRVFKPLGVMTGAAGSGAVPQGKPRFT